MTARRIDYAVLLLGLVVLWQALYFLAGPEAMAPPVATIRRLAVLMAGERFWNHVAASGFAFLYACLIALVGGLALGIALGTSQLAVDVADPILGTLYSIPKITLYPVILLLFGLGISAKVAFGALHGIFPVTLFAMGAIKNISSTHLKMARVLRLTPVQTALTVLLPSALPEIVTGLRVGFSATLFGTLIGELFASNQGLGFMLIRAMDAHNVPDIMALTFLLFSTAAAANSLLLAIEHRV
ncbi:MAG: ABC transporter permease subunit, partial [Proteobacteria bacterium]|nr:ABC transporter permease subunit [Pseudomonadota bacterium]